MPTGLPKLSFKNVSRSFADRIILKDISFNLEKGGRYALLGPNGAGKSTLMRLIAGQLRPDEGEILLDGICPWQDAGARLNMGFLSEGIPLAADLTVEEQLNLAAALRGLTKESTEKEKEKLRCDLNLELIYKRPAGLLSHGQARRTALASAVIGSPDFLLLDELSSGLDPEETDRLCVFINNLAPNCTLLISSHILEEVFAWTQKAIIINQGRLISIGQWQTIFPAAVCGQTLRAEYLKFLAADRGCP